MIYVLKHTRAFWKRICLLCITLIPLYAQEEDMSLMLSPAEQEAIGLTEYAALHKNRTARTPQLEGFIYVNDQEWFVWISGVHLHANKRQSEHITILDISPNRLKIQWHQQEHILTT